MRDPMNWALPVGRVFGIPVKIHLFFFIIILGLVLRQIKDSPTIWWGDIVFFSVFLLFGIVLLHELGHCFGARWVEGEAKEILIWPLGGLAFTDVPNNWKANFITTAAGPAVNVLICVACSILLAIGGYFPSLNPFANPYTAELYSFSHARTETSVYSVKIYRPGTNEEVPSKEFVESLSKRAPETALNSTRIDEFNQSLAKLGYERGLVPSWAVWVYRAFWLSWWMFLFNLIPAYPLDGGRMLQEIVWARSSYRQGTTVAAYSGFGVSVIFLILSITLNESLLMGLGLFMLISSYMALKALEVEEGPFGYDFSAGYTSLEKDEEPPPRRRRRQGFLGRWWQARKMRKLQLEHDERQRDEERMDQLLDKIARTGKESLTDEERRFLERASTRYRNRS